MTRVNSHNGERSSRTTVESNTVYHLCVDGIPNGYAWQTFKDDIRETGARVSQAYIKEVRNDGTYLGTCDIRGIGDVMLAYDRFAPKNLPRCQLRIRALEGESKLAITHDRYIDCPLRTSSANRRPNRSIPYMASRVSASGSGSGSASPMNSSAMTQAYHYPSDYRNSHLAAAFASSHNASNLQQHDTYNGVMPSHRFPVNTSPASSRLTTGMRQQVYRQMPGTTQEDGRVEQRLNRNNGHAQASSRPSFPRPQADEFVPSSMRREPLVVDGSRHSTRTIRVPDSDDEDEDSDDLQESRRNRTKTRYRGSSV